MKNLLKKSMAFVCAGLMLSAFMMPFSADAEKNDDSPVLPSGITVNQMREIFEEEKYNVSDEPDFASAALAVFQGDDILYEEYFGSIDMKNNIPADKDSVYEWGSISKTLIWVSAMQLYEKGVLDFDRDVREYLPDGFFQHLSYDEPITMMNLMNHNAGWQEISRPIFIDDENNVPSLHDALQEIEPLQINPPGKITAYSNYGAAVAGYVIECISGQDYCEYVHENIFEPLGMEHTSLNPTHSDNDWVYENRKKTKTYHFSMGKCIDMGNGLDYIPAYPAGSATGTLSDLITYAQALVNDDAPLFQSPETQKLMFTGTDFYGDSDIPMSAHGFCCQEYAVRTYGHDGATTAFMANMIFDIESKTGLVVMVNEQSGNFFFNNTPSLVFGKMNHEKYIEKTFGKKTFKGYYLPARSTHKGMLKFIPYLSAIRFSDVGEAENIGNGVYIIGSGDNSILISEQVTPDNKLVALESTFMSYLPDNLYFVKICMFMAYALLAIVSVFIILINRKLKKHGKLVKTSCSSLRTAGQIANIISVLALISFYVIYYKNNGGVPYISCAVIGIIQIMCIAICAITAISSVVVFIKEKNRKIIYLGNILSNIIITSNILYFEMYKFWEM